MIKIEYLKNEKSIFEGLLFGEKIKTWQKIAGTSFKWGKILMAYLV